MSHFRIVALTAACVIAAHGVALAQDTVPPPPAAPKTPAAEPKRSDIPQEARAGLAIGDAAPPLLHVNWIQGWPVTKFETGQVYVLDFWATWCGPCVKAIPHMASLHEKYSSKGLNIIGVAIWPNEKMKPTAEFVKMLGEAKMPYRVCADVDAKTADAYMKATGMNAIPTVMIIDREGKLAWVGHPEPTFDRALDLVMDGKFDAVAFEAAERAKANQADEIQRGMKAALDEKRWEDLVKGFEQMIALDPERYAEFNIYKYDALVNRIGDLDRARAFSGTMLEGPMGKSPEMLNALAWYIIDPQGQVAEEKRDLDLAMSAAKKAETLTQGKEPAILDSLARTYFLKGNVAEAVKTQQRAVDLVDDVGMKAQLQRTLDDYNRAGGAG